MDDLLMEAEDCGATSSAELTRKQALRDLAVLDLVLALVPAQESIQD